MDSGGTCRDDDGARPSSEETFRTLVEAAEDGIVLTDLAGRELFSNMAYLRSLGYSRDEAPTGSRLALVHPDDQEWVAAEMASIANHGSMAGEYRVRHRDGRWLYHHTTAAVVRDATGQPTGILSIVRDVTARKEAEAELRQAKAQLESVFRALPDLYFRARMDGTIVDYRAGRTIDLYVLPVSFLGKRIGDILPPQVAARAEEAIRAARSGEVASFEYELEMPTGPSWYEARLVAVDDDEVVVIIRNITERRRSEVERIELERRLLHAQKLESLGVLAGGIAHDFNNLLMAILGNLDIANLLLPPDSPGAANLEQAIQASNRAADLTRQLLAYTGKGELVASRVDVGQLVADNVRLLRTSIGGGVTLTVREEAPVTTILADASQLQQVVMNLITNAAEAYAGQPGEVVLTTGEVECGELDLASSRIEERPQPGRFVVVEVRDAGCGMDATTQGRLFDPFFTTKFTGRGLGMSAVLGIIRGHGGAITVDSTVGAGTTVRVLLPVDGTGPEAALAPSAATPVELPASGVVLVVDDDEAVRDLAAQYVRRLGLEAIVAAGGAAALEALERCGGEVAWVILDLVMPEMDGVTTFAAMKRRWPDLKVLLASGFAEEDAMGRFPDVAPVGFVQKPYRLTDLARKLRAGGTAR